MRPSLLIVSPTPECLCLAAAIRSLWTDFRIAGAQIIGDVLHDWADATPRGDVIVMVEHVNDPGAVNRVLKSLSNAQVHVTWFTEGDSPSVVKSCMGVNGVKLYSNRPLRDQIAEFSRVASPILDPLQDVNLNAYLRYKINRFFMKGMDEEELIPAVEKLASVRNGHFDLMARARKDAESVERFRQTDFPYIEGFSAPLAEMKRRIMQVAPTDLSVLIIGETGTGKEVIAAYLHEFNGRRQRPIVSINCAGLEETFLRSELFGHVKGAFTGATTDREGLAKKADGGTLFLDELADMPLTVQADLLRFLQSRDFRPLGSNKTEHSDVRFVAAAQPALYEKMKRGEFRDDLYFRVAEVEITAPPLREVPEDIPRIIRHTLYSLREKDPNNPIFDRIDLVRDYFREGADILDRHTWPGNVRELSRYVKRKLHFDDDVLREIRDGAGKMEFGKETYPIFKPILSARDIEPADDIKKRYVQHVWAHRGDQTQQEVAKALGLSVNTLKGLVK